MATKKNYDKMGELTFSIRFQDAYDVPGVEMLLDVAL